MYWGKCELTAGIPFEAMLNFRLIAFGKPVSKKFQEPNYSNLSAEKSSFQTRAVWLLAKNHDKHDPQPLTSTEEVYKNKLRMMNNEISSALGCTAPN